jgi:type I restriction enzyme S subunit
MNNLVPDGWETTNISQTCDVFDSKRIPLNSQERASRKGEYPYYGANGVQGWIDGFIFEGEYVLLAEDGGNFDQWEQRPDVVK